MQLRVHPLDVPEGDRLAQQLAVEGGGEATLQVVAVEGGDAQHAPRKVEVRKVLRIDAWKSVHHTTL